MTAEAYSTVAMNVLSAKQFFEEKDLESCRKRLVDARLVLSMLLSDLTRMENDQ